MLEEEEEFIMVTAPVAWGPASAEGSGVTECSKCGCTVWISPASMDLAIEKKAKIQCIPCVTAEIDPEDTIHVYPPSPEQAREIREALKKDG